MGDLPPLAAIRAFEAAARHLSFTKAGDELGMTQAAISYQIKLLEERIGASLFVRRPRQLALSEVGARLAPEVGRAFDLMRTAFADSRDKVDGTLSITTVPIFASHWLAQNVGLFQMQHPDIAVRLDASTHVVDFASGTIDLAIRGTDRVPAGLIGHLLTKADFSPMLSPALAASIGGVHEPADLLKLPLVDAADPWFAQWFAEAGVKNFKLGDKPASWLGTQSLEAVAAVAGRGVAMLTPAFYADDIATGRLIQPFPLQCWAGNSYYLMYPESRRNAPKIRAFRDWIIAATTFMRPDTAQ